MQKKFLNSEKNIVLELACSKTEQEPKSGLEMQLHGADDPNGPPQSWTPAVIPVQASLMCFYQALLKLLGGLPPLQLQQAGMDALHLSQLPWMQYVCKLEAEKQLHCIIARL